MEKKTTRISRSFLSAQFNQTITNTYNLSILYGIDRLLYFVSVPILTDNTTTHAVLAFKTLTAPEQQLEDALSNEPLLQYPFQTVKIAYLNSHNTLIPNMLYDEQFANIYLEKSFHLLPNHYYLINHLPSLQCQNIYLLPIQVYNAFHQLFPNQPIYHAATALLMAWQQIAVQFTTPSAFLNMKDGQFQICVFEKEKLLLYNTFHFQSSKDCLYFVLLVFDQLNLDVETTPLYVSGDLLEGSEIERFLKKYIREIAFTPLPPSFHSLENWELNHLDFDLLSLYTCG